MPTWTVHTDGHVDSRGLGAWAFVVTDERGARIEARTGPAPPGSPPHLVEWLAVHEALRWLAPAAPPGTRVDLVVDSALVEKGLASRKPEMSGEAGALRAHSRRLLARLAEKGVPARVRRVPRAENRAADALSRREPREG